MYLQYWCGRIGIEKEIQRPQATVPLLVPRSAALIVIPNTRQSHFISRHKTEELQMQSWVAAVLHFGTLARHGQHNRAKQWRRHGSVLVEQLARRERSTIFRPARRLRAGDRDGGRGVRTSGGTFRLGLETPHSRIPVATGELARQQTTTQHTCAVLLLDCYNC